MAKVRVVLKPNSEEKIYDNARGRIDGPNNVLRIFRISGREQTILAEFQADSYQYWEVVE
jgi:hypothetical protein